VVMRTSLSYGDRLGELLGYLKPRVDTDLLVYTPEEWRDLRETRPFVARIAREGMVLYESDEA